MTPEIIVEIERLITTIGFPIVCVIFMWRKITESDEKCLTKIKKAGFPNAFITVTKTK